jgi:hypothetical protein
MQYKIPVDVPRLKINKLVNMWKVQARKGGYISFEQEHLYTNIQLGKHFQFSNR